MAQQQKPPFSLDKWFDGKGPEPYWLDPSGYVGIFPDEFPAPGVLHHLMVMVRTPEASRNSVRLPWSDLPAEIRVRVNDLTDMVMSRARGLTGEHTVLVESNRNAIEPHRHVLVGDQPQSLWTPGRIGNPDFALTSERQAATAEALGMTGLAPFAELLFTGTDWSVLGRPQSTEA